MSRRVILRPEHISMNLPLQLNRKSPLRTVEVDDKRPHAVLPAKLYTQLRSLQAEPECRFCRGEIRPSSTSDCEGSLCPWNFYLKLVNHPVCASRSHPAWIEGVAKRHCRNRIHEIPIAQVGSLKLRTKIFPGRSGSRSANAERLPDRGPPAAAIFRPSSASTPAFR